MPAKRPAHWSRLDRLEDRVTPATAWTLSGGSLIAFDTANPTVTRAAVPVVGVAAGEALVGIDFRPQNGFLYALGVNATADSGTLYAVSARTGQASAVGGAPGLVALVDAGGNPVDLPDPATIGYGIDFNPAADRLRVVAGGLNFRVDPNTGAAVDGDLGGAANSVAGTNADAPVNGGTTTVDSTAYTNNAANVTVTTQYTLDSASNSLSIQNPPNSGTQTLVAAVTLGGSPLDFGGIAGFDIPVGVNAAASGGAATGSGLAVLSVGGSAGLYSIDLATGAATLVGPVTGPVTGFAIQNDSGGLPAVALSADGTQLVRFNTASPGTVTTVALSGVTAGETLVGLDLRPQTGQYYALGVNSTTDTGTLYLVSPQNVSAGVDKATAVAIGAPGSVAFQDAGGGAVDLPDPAVAGYGFDFNPSKDRVRVTTSTGLNFRINPSDGTAVDGDFGGAANSVANTNPDGALNGLPGGSTGVSGTAYTNSFGQPLTGGQTTQYTLDAASNQLFIQDAPNAGTQTQGVGVTLGGAPLDFTDVSGFDISGGVAVTTSGAKAAGRGFAVLTVGGVAKAYSIDLTTGVAAELGATTVPLAGLAVGDAPAGTVQFQSATTTVGEAVAGGTTSITLTRTGGSSGALTVTLAATLGTAEAGDFTAPPTTVTFADGQTELTVTLPILNDAVFEGDETLTLTLSAPTAGVLGTQVTNAVTITEDEAQPTLSITGVTVTEGNSGTVAALLTVTLSGRSEAAVTALLSTANGSALTPGDYAALTNQLVTFAAGATTLTQQIPIQVVGDTVVESNETFTASLSSPTGATLAAGQGTATVTITDDDTLPTVTISPATLTVAEGNGTGVTANFTLTLSAASATAVTVRVRTAVGTAGPDDFTAVDTTVTFAPGETTKTVQVAITGDTADESDEAFTVALSDPAGATLGSTATATATIGDDDAPVSPPPPPTVTITGSTVSETAGNATLTLTLSAASTTPITVVVNTSNGTATAGLDYTAVSARTVTFAAGQTTQTVLVPILTDALTEGTETFAATLSNASGATIAGSAATVTVTDVPPVSPPPPPAVRRDQNEVAQYALGAGSSVEVRGPDDAEAFTLAPLGTSAGDTVRTVTADVTGDGTPDVITGSGRGVASRVVVTDGATRQESKAFTPFERSFTGGVNVAAGDVNGDGFADVIVSAGAGGGSRLAVFDGKTGALLADFTAFADDPNFRGGLWVSAGDVDGDGFADIALAAGDSGGPRIAVIDGETVRAGRAPARLFADFFAFSAALRDGATVAVGDLDGDGKAEIFAGGTSVAVFDGQTLLSSNKAVSERAFSVPGLTAGLRVTVKDLDADNLADLFVSTGDGGTVRRFADAALATGTGVPESTALGVVDGTTALGVFVG